ncbi:MAG: Ig-like domain-containing protein, partial [Terriglobales bacterium]
MLAGVRSRFVLFFLLPFSVAVVLPAKTPTGTVTFYDGATALGTGTLNGSGIATYTTSSLAVGQHSMTAV